MPDATSQQPPQVFISAKSEDYRYAEQLYYFLDRNGISIFLSPVSLRQLGEADYRDAIDRALEHAQHLIVVASRPEYVESQWVKAEWGMFANELRSGRKSGNLVTVIVGDLQPADLPITLRNYEVIPWDDKVFEAVWAYVRPTAGASPTYPIKPRPSGWPWWIKILLILVGLILVLVGTAAVFGWLHGYSPLLSLAPQQSSVPPAPPSDAPTTKPGTPGSSSDQVHPYPADDGKSIRPEPEPRPAVRPPDRRPEPGTPEPKTDVPPYQAPGPRASIPVAPAPRATIYLDTSAILGKGAPARTDIYLQKLVQEVKIQLQAKGIAVASLPQPDLPTVKLVPPGNHRIFIPSLRDGDGMVTYGVALNVQVTPSVPGQGAKEQVLPILAFGRDFYEPDAISLAVRQAASDIAVTIVSKLVKEN